MTVPASSHYQLDPWRLRQLGAYDVPVDGPEARVYLDPRLLRRTVVPEFQDAMERVGMHFALVFEDIRAAQRLPPAQATQARAIAKRRLLFPELDGLRIGFGEGNAPGKGMGTKRANDLFKLALQFVQDDFSDPALFEMFTVVQDGVGADLVSDMLASINRHALFAFSERLGHELQLTTRPLVTAERTYELPWNDRREEHLLFPPYDAVAEIPAFRASKQFDKFEFSNEQIRKAISEWIKKHSSQDVRRYLLEHRDQVKVVLAAYTQSKPREPDHYGGANGPLVAGREIFEGLKKDLATRPPPSTPNELEAAISDVTTRFKEYVDAGKARPQLHGGKAKRDEKFVQNVFANFIEVYCQLYDIRCTREANDGMGPVDFLFSRGDSMALALELKLSTNPGILRTYEFQVQAYAGASRAQSMFFVVIDLTDERKRLEALVKKHDAAVLMKRPRLFVIDGRDSPPASKIQTARERIPQPGDFLKKSPSAPRRPAELPAKSLATSTPPSVGEILLQALEAMDKRRQERERERR